MIDPRKFFALGAVLAIGCDESTRPITPPPPPPVMLASISVAPASAMIAPGETQAFTATGMKADGSSVALSAEVVWSSSDDAIATISSSGVATAVADGTSTIRAKVGMLEAAATLVVATTPGIESIAIEPATADLQIGASVQLAATARLTDGTTMDVTNTATWSSSDEAIARVANGLVTGLASGTADITATQGAHTSPSARITVSDVPLARLIIAPEMLTVALGLTQQFTATAVYEDNSMRDVTNEVLWESSNPAVASVTNAGLAQSLSIGFTSITATDMASGIHVSASLIVSAPALATLELSPPNASIARNGSQTFRADARYTDGTTRDLTAIVDWASSDPMIAVLGVGPMQRSTFVAVAVGTVTISATDPMTNVRGEATLTVTPPALTGIAVIPMSISIALGRSQTFSAVGLFDDNSNADITDDVMWSSSDPAVATIDNAGIATSVATGVTTIRATDPVTGVASDMMLSATLTVTPAELVSLAVTPSARAMVLGSSLQFNATGTFTDGTSSDRTNAVTWSSSAPSVVSINAGGLARADGEGPARIIARDPTTNVSSDDSNQSAQISVSIANLVSISVSPTSTTVPAGADLRFTATGAYDNGANLDLTGAVTWSSSQPAIARIDGASGVATAIASGTTQISALEPLTGISSNTTASLTVSNASSVTSINIAPANTTVGVGRTREFTATARFSGGEVHAVTHSVTWSSSNTTRATIDLNGIATGVALGMVTIDALDVASGVTALAGNGAAALTVVPGIVIASGTYPGPMISVDGTANYSVDFGSVVFAASAFPAGAVITDVDVSIDFRKTDGTCAAPASGFAYHNETNFRLLAPSGSTVVLAPPNTWSGGVATGVVTVVFDQSAAAIPSATPVSGSFLPNTGDLHTLDGQSPTGTWILQVGDSGGSDPLCVHAYTITVTAQ